jgi:hypothetical protein
MTEFLNEDEYEALRLEISDGTASLKITRNMSRQFFTHVSHRNVQDLTGSSVLSQKLLVLSMLLSSILLVLGCLAEITLDFGWLAIIGVPLAGIFWTVLAGLTTEMGDIWSSTLAMIAAIGLIWFLPESYQLFTALFTGSVYLYRTAHILSEYLLRRLVSESYDAFDMLSEHIEIVRHAD